MNRLVNRPNTSCLLAGLQLERQPGHNKKHLVTGLGDLGVEKPQLVSEESTCPVLGNDSHAHLWANNNQIPVWRECRDAFDKVGVVGRHGAAGAVPGVMGVDRVRDPGA